MFRPFSSALAALTLATAAGAADHTAAERGRIEAEIQRLNNGFAAEESDCQQRFVVTSCVEEVRLRRRDTLAPLRARLLALDDADRRQRASARLAAIEDKRRAQRESVPEPPPPRPAVERSPLAASAPLLVVRRDETGAARQQAASAAAAQRVVAAKRRQQQADQDAARVREKLLERERSGKSAAPLPVPAAPG